jgi:hypothetical protein
VLYNTVLKASDSNVDVLGLLKSCKQQGSNQGPPFVVEWAGHSASRCPNLELSAGPVDLIAMFGRAPILAGDWPRFAWGNLRQGGLYLAQHTQSNMACHGCAAFSDALLGRALMALSLRVFLALPFVFVLMHHAVLMPLSRAYRQLSFPQRLVTCQHAVHAAVFGASLIPQTLMACRYIFGVWDGEIVATRLGTTLSGFIMSRCGLYLIEGGVRAVKWSWVLFAHHVIFMALLAQNVAAGNPALCVIGAILDLFACHEAPLYAALVAYRLRAPTRVARGVLRSAVAWYIITRVLQTAMLAYMITHLVGLPQINREPAFIVTAAMCVALTVIQVYTVAIYMAIDRKLGKQQKAQAQQQQQPSVCALPGMATDAGVTGFQQLSEGDDESAWVSDGEEDPTAAACAAAGDCDDAGPGARDVFHDHAGGPRHGVDQAAAAAKKKHA